MKRNVRGFLSILLILGLITTSMQGIVWKGSIAIAQAKEESVVIPGTPYDASGKYDVSVPHVIINQVYGGGDNKGAGSHGFIELYNPTEKEVDLSAWSVQYQGSIGDTENEAGWHKLDLTGRIPARSSYLIRTKIYKADQKKANFEIPEGDMQWDEVTINAKGVSVVLMSNQDLLTDNNIFDNTGKKPVKDAYVDLVGVNGNDGLKEQEAPAYEGYTTAVQSAKKAVRRLAFQDTDYNAVGEDDGDFIIIEYNATDPDYLNWAKPRSSKDGAWQASEMPEFKETTVLSDTEINVLTNSFGDNVESSRQFTWQMPESFSQAYIAISANSDMSDSVNFDAVRSLNHKENASVFRVCATGLEKKSTYYYQAVCGEVKSPIYSFQTGSLSDDFTFVRASDSQSKTEEGYDIFQKTVTKINDTYHPSFIMETGDLVDTNYFEDEWRWLLGKSQPVFASTAYIPVIGNHEESSSYKAWAFREHFSVPNQCKGEEVTPGTVYSFDYGKAHFVILNSECKGEGLQAQADWLAQDMAATRQKYIIVSIHRGPYGGLGIARELEETFVPIFDKYKVDLVLFGHDHSYIRTKALKNGVEDKDGTVYLESGGSALKQDAANATIPEYAEITGTPGKPVYDVITVTDECIKVKTVAVDETRDSISSLADIGDMNYVTAGAVIDFSLLPKVRTIEPTARPTEKPTAEPTARPTAKPTEKPTVEATTVNKFPQKGKTYVVGKSKYIVTAVSKTKGTVTYLGNQKKNSKKVTIPDAVKINSVSCKVDAVSSNAFKKNSKLTNVILGKNVKKLGAKAFYGCKNLKRITIRSKILSKAGAKVFAGTHKKLVIKVPAKKLAAYKKLFKKKGLARLNCII